MCTVRVMLQYYNTVFLEKGLISQSEYRTMQVKIRSVYTPAAKITETGDNSCTSTKPNCGKM